jgi:hypothetical protein
MEFSFLFSSYWRLEVRKIRRAALSDLFTRSEAIEDFRFLIAD